MWINLDATGAAHSANVWTGGPIDAIPPTTCGDWASTTGSAGFGLTWDDGSSFDVNVTRPCVGLARVYCAER